MCAPNWPQTNVLQPTFIVPAIAVRNNFPHCLRMYTAPTMTTFDAFRRWLASCSRLQQSAKKAICRFRSSIETPRQWVVWERHNATHRLTVGAYDSPVVCRSLHSLISWYNLIISIASVSRFHCRRGVDEQSFSEAASHTVIQCLMCSAAVHLRRPFALSCYAKAGLDPLDDCAILRLVAYHKCLF